MNLHTDIGNGILWTMVMYEEFLMLKMMSFVACVGVDLELYPEQDCLVSACGVMN